MSGARRKRGILRMVTSYVIFFSLGAMVLTSGFLISFGVRSHREAVSSSLELAALYAADNAERFIGQKIDFLKAAKWIEGNALEADITDRSILDGILSLSSAFLQVAAVDKAGAVLGRAARRSSAAARVAGLPFAAEAVKETAAGRTFLSPVYIDPVTDEPLITLGVSLIERLGESDLTLIAELNLKFMWDLVADLDVEYGGRAYVVDSSGALVAYGDSSRVLAHERLSRIPAVASFIAGGRDPKPGTLLSFRGIEGDSVVGTFIPLENPLWAVVIELPWQIAYRGAIRIIVFGIALVAAMSTAIAFTGSFLAKGLSSPILSLAEAVSGMAKTGELAGVKASGPREVAELAESFNAMAERIKHNEKRFKRLIWNSSDIIAVADAEGTLTYLSSSIERIFGYLPAEAIGKPLASFMRSSDAEKVALLFSSLSREKGAVERNEFKMRTRGGRWADVEMIAVNLIDDPDIGGMLLNLRDVSERMEAEREKTRLQDRLQHAMKMEAVGRLAGGIAHDFNNLLTSIYGSVQLARMEENDPEKVEFYLKEIRKEAESAASLTRQLLAYSRKQPIEPKLVDLNALILDVGGMLERLIGADVAMAFSLGQDLGPVRLDSGQFQQVLVNLVANARDAMPGGGKLDIRTESAILDENDCLLREGLKPGRHLKLTVEDNGMGMSEESLRHLFEPFYTTKAVGKGTGLGLAMVYGAVRQSGGSIEASSELGRGTTISILLPMEKGAAERADHRAAEECARGTEKLLLVEDRPAVLEITARMIMKLGYEVVRAGSGEEALKVLGSDERIDGLITDVSMPVMNGVELAIRAKDLRPGIKTLFVSGYAEEVLKREDAIKAIGRFVMKPYTIQELAAKLRETLEGTQ